MSITTSKYTRTFLMTFATGLALAACKPSTPPAESSPPAAEATATTAPASNSVPAADASVPSSLNVLDEASRTAPVDRTGMCSFDSIDGVKVDKSAVARFQNPGATKITGWVADQASMVPAEHARLLVENTDRSSVWESDFGPLQSRKDVAKYYKTAALNDSGFSMTVDFSSLPAGIYRLSAVHTANGRTLMCPGPQVEVGG